MLARAAVGSPIRPRWSDAIRSQIGNHLAHVLVRVRQESKVDAADAGFLAEEMKASIEFCVAGASEGFLDGRQGAFQHRNGGRLIA
jgi:hypothetical protein